MPGVIGETESLVAAIQKSEEYLSYNEHRAALMSEAGLSDRVDAFRRKVFLLQNSAKRDDDQKALEKLEEEYRDVLNSSKVMEYLAAEKTFLDMMKAVYDRIGTAVAFDLSFLKEKE